MTKNPSCFFANLHQTAFYPHPSAEIVPLFKQVDLENKAKFNGLFVGEKKFVITSWGGGGGLYLSKVFHLMSIELCLRLYHPAPKREELGGASTLQPWPEARTLW